MSSHRQKKRFGQNFLVDTRQQNRLIDAVESIRRPHMKTLCEIGPGAGALTQHWKGRFARVVLIELDRELAAEWRDRATEYAFAGTQLDIIEDDAARVDFRRVDASLICGNLPFNAATAIYSNIVATKEPGAELILMFQKEVGQRLMAREGKTYGSLSVLSQAYGSWTKLMEIPPRAFRPAPKVAAWVVHQTIAWPQGWTRDHFAFLEKLVFDAFSQRRKQVIPRLKEKYPGFASAWVDHGWRITGRAEELTPEGWRRLAEDLLKR
jgi:16S rRNA (adenine1518-N6/adenine1519-N6)-dimethyltransferase